jgi:hypothetical protein
LLAAQSPATATEVILRRSTCNPQQPRPMKPPPLLLGATLLFWGWQSGYFVVGVVMAVALESANFLKARWEFSDDDFSRIWTFCSLLFLAAAVYTFTANEGPSTFSGFFQNPNPLTQRAAGRASSRTGASMGRWLPMFFFAFVAAQMFSTRQTVPLTTISLILRRRRRKAQQLRRPVPAERNVNIGYPYFAICLLSAAVHPGEDNSFFWGLCVLLTWALWAQRSRRFAFGVWAGALVVAVGLGFVGQRGVGELQRYLENLNPQWIGRFMRRGLGFDPTQSRTALGAVGELKTSGAIVIRLETRNGESPPTYLRSASYRLYSTPVWFAGSSKDDFQTIPETPPESRTWQLLIKTNAATVNIACYLDGRGSNSLLGLLPLPRGSGRLENLNAYLLRTNTAGAALAEGPRLVMFDALYGPGETIDSPPGTSPDPDEDLDVPDREKESLDAVIDQLQLRGAKRDRALRTLGGFFADKFSYSTWQGARTGRTRGTNETPLSRFLLSTRTGHCEYFATATVLLLRRLEIPARYAVGYAVHEGSGRKYVVRQRDAHAWCLVWDKDTNTWQDFDTTPASWVEVEAKRAAPLQWLSDAWSRIGFEIARIRWGQSRLRQYLLIVIVPALGLLLYQIIFKRGRRRRRGEKDQPGLVTDWPGLDSEFYLLEKKLGERGIPRDPGETVSGWLERVATSSALADLRAPLNELLRLHYRYRFDPLGLSEMDRETLRREARACLEELSTSDRATVAIAK